MTESSNAPVSGDAKNLAVSIWQAPLQIFSGFFFQWGSGFVLNGGGAEGALF